MTRSLLPAARSARAGIAAAALMWLAFAVYVVLHSPLRDVAARLAGRPGQLAYLSALGDIGLTAPLNAAVAFVAIATNLWRFGRGWRPAPRLVKLRAFVNGPVLIMGGLAAILIGTSAFVALTRPPTGFDALAYHGPMSVYFWRDGNLADLLFRAPGTFAMALPGSAELWFGLLLIAGGEPFANIGQLPFVVMGGMAVYGFARRSRVPLRAAAMSALSSREARMTSRHPLGPRFPIGSATR